MITQIINKYLKKDGFVSKDTAEKRLSKYDPSFYLFSTVACRRGQTREADKNK
jgi:hypothetical protein